MVKPLNREWELFGPKYRVHGAKGEKVDCNACHKQVSAAVNRLQSHMRICPARATFPPGFLTAPTTPLALPPAPQVLSMDGTTSSSQTEGKETMIPAEELTADTAASTATVSTDAAVASVVEEPSAKRQRTSPSPSRLRPVTASNGSLSVDDYWFNAGIPMLAPAVAAGSGGGVSAYMKRHLELEEQRMQLELKRDEREERAHALKMEVLAAQVKRERLALEKEARDAKVELAMARKQLRDQGISEEEVERIFPVEITTSQAI